MPRLPALLLTALLGLSIFPARAQMPSLCESTCKAELTQCRKDALATKGTEGALPVYTATREPSQIGDYTTVAEAARRENAGIQGRLEERYTDCQNAHLRCRQNCPR
ncbi:MAG: hypothetical protein LWW92_01645 [Rhodocyclales bacterium]|nr:hypothetical protein [Rhodocyclales bacterium]